MSYNELALEVADHLSIPLQDEGNPVKCLSQRTTS